LVGYVDETCPEKNTFPKKSRVFFAIIFENRYIPLADAPVTNGQVHQEVFQQFPVKTRVYFIAKVRIGNVGHIESVPVNGYSSRGSGGAGRYHRPDTAQPKPLFEALSAHIKVTNVLRLAATA